MNKNDQLLVIDPKLISGGSSVASNESPIIRTEEEEFLIYSIYSVLLLSFINGNNLTCNL